jgi:MFS family permease
MLLVLAELLAMALWFSASAVLPALSLEWGLEGGEQAWLTMAVQLGFVAGALASALLNLPDRVSNARLFALSAVGGALATAAIPALDAGLRGGLVLRFLTGVAAAGIYPPAMRIAATWSLRRRGLAIGLVVGALTAGSALPHLLNGALAFGEAGPPSWRAVLWLAAALALAGAAVVALGVREGPHLARAARFDWRRARRAGESRPLRRTNLGYHGHMGERWAMWTWVPLFLALAWERAGHAPSAGHLAGFAVVAAGAPGCVVGGLLADRFGRTAVTIASLAVSGACCLVAGPTAGDPWLATVVCLVWGFAVVADSAQFSASVSELAEPSSVGTALTVQTSLGFLLTTVSIRVLVPLAERWSWSTAFAMLALGPAFGIVAMLRLRALPEARRLAGGRR